MTFFHAHTTLTPTPPLTQPPSDPPADLKISQLPSPNDTLEQDFNNLSELVLHTRTLGEHVGTAWQLERVMRWVPNFDHHTDPSGIRKEEGGSSGFFKIRGTTVEAVVGGVFYQFGGVAAHRLFHTRVLPHLIFLLPTEYRKPAEAAYKRLGGPSAPILLSSQLSHLQLQNPARSGSPVILIELILSLNHYVDQGLGPAQTQDPGSSGMDPGIYVPSVESLRPGNALNNAHDLTSTTKVVGFKAFAYGSSSDVWRGVNWSRGDARDVAVKVIRASKRSELGVEEIRKWVSKEINTWGAVTHPICQVADGLDYLHSHNPRIAHGQIKACNILIKHDGTALIAGFGLSRFVTDISTGSRRLSNTIRDRWTAPELLDDVSDHIIGLTTTASDVWAFGFLCIEILLGTIPWDSNKGNATVMTLKERASPPLPDSIKSTPVGHIIRHCWIYEPSQRPSMAQLVHAISENDLEYLHTPVCVLLSADALSDSSHKATTVPNLYAVPDSDVVHSLQTYPSSPASVSREEPLLLETTFPAAGPHRSSRSIRKARQINQLRWPHGPDLYTSSPAPWSGMEGINDRNVTAWPHRVSTRPFLSPKGVRQNSVPFQRTEVGHPRIPVESSKSDISDNAPAHSAFELELLAETFEKRSTQWGNALISAAREQTPGSPLEKSHISSPSNNYESSADFPSDPQTPASVSKQMTIREVISHLVAHGCQDLTKEIDNNAFTEHPVSHGGFSDIYRGRLLDNAHVAIKVLRISATGITEDLKHFKHAARELHTWSKCAHPNVLSLLGLAEFRGRIGMISPWMTQGSLPRYLERTPDANRYNLCVQLCDGLSFMHQIGIIHGDLKGANHQIHEDNEQQFLDTTVASELITGSGSQSQASDVYALGMTIYEVFSGTLPYDGKLEHTIMYLVIVKREPPERPASIPTGRRDGDELWDLLLRCWAFEATARPTASEVTGAMRTIAMNEF
ncbi:protein tyrosine kinase domain-containing protein [Rhizoctonia solani]|uniref:Protein tyrosine kinase domain-containing protein n=1 Tax=Rhizoctonia solani TaxID=456999 RepID=A0A8H8T037_9AGAM|nr:protein tyrosine kinase domain-containing protein [Rhizoctonia solani]QRW23247.1 protein tyrosine kinase domain-containing protein [Rhizoctonia solani]